MMLNRFTKNDRRPTLVGARWRFVFSVITCVIFGGLHGVSVAANPTPQDHDQPLAAHNTITGAEKQIQLMYAKFGEWEKLVIASTESANSGGNFSHRQLSKIYPDVYRGIWHAQHLQAMGEPAGFDLYRKFTVLHAAMGIFASKLGEFHQQEIDKLTKDSPNRLKMLAKVRELADQGKLVEAERQIQAYHVKQLASIFYLRHPQAKPFENQVFPLHNEILGQLNAQRKSAYREQALQKINSFAAALVTLQEESDRIRAELSKSPSVTLAEGTTGDAADAIGYVHTLWGNASASITRSVALAWAFGGGDIDTTAEPLLAKLREAESIANDAISGILQSATQSTPTDQIAKLVPRILMELSMIDRRYMGQLDPTIIGAVEKLVAKNADVAEQAKRYAEATLEPTRWMRRYTRQQVDLIAREYPDASSLLNQKLVLEDSIQPSIYGRAGGREQVLTVGSLTRPANWIAGDAKSVLGKQIKEEGSVRLTRNSASAIVPQDPRHYTNLPATFGIEKYRQELDQCLLLDDLHGPLDLPSADAMTSAKFQEFDRVGGSIAGLTLEPYLTRFATLPDGAHDLVPLNRLPAIDVRGPAIEKVIWRVDLKPEWVAHQYFLAR